MAPKVQPLIKSPKSPQQQQQQQQFQWNQCSACGYIILKSNNDEHECFKLNNSHSYIFKNELLNVQQIIEHPKDIDKDLEMNKEYLFDFLFLNPQTMSLCGFKIGSPLLIEYTTSDSSMSPSYICCTCWPLHTIQIDRISLNKQYTLSNQIDTIKRIKLYTKHPYEINKLNLTILSSNHSNILTSITNQDQNLIINYLKNIYLNKLIINNQQLQIVYLGHRLQFQVLNILSNAKSSSSLIDRDGIDDSLLSINKQLNNLNLNNELKFIEIQNNNQILLVESPLSSLNISFYSINNNTIIEIDVFKHEINANNENNDLKLIKFNNIGGLDNEIELVKELFVYPFEEEYSHLYRDIGIDVSKGVILYGSSGCGKSLLARAILNEIKCSFIELNTSDVFSRNYGESETKLKNVFNQAWNRSPCVIFIDELDTLCGRRESLQHDLEKRIVSLFSNLMDQSMKKNILFLATTNKIDTIDLSLRRPGRFDKEIEISIPNQVARYEILKIHLKTVKQCLNDDEINEISQNCHGYVGADLKMLIHEAAMSCMKRVKSKNEHRSIELSDFYEALHKVKASAMREITFDIPKVYWCDIGGQDELKKKLQQAITWPIKYANQFKQLGLKAPRGLLMYGPPGCSKTMIAKALATETGLNFIAVKGPELFSKWVGESERMVREIFRKARNAAPAIIFFDEIDAVAVERSNSSNKSNNVGDRVLAQLLNEIDGIENLNDVTIVAATNRPDMIDKALMRPGRLDRIVYVKLPDEETRREIFKLKFKQMPISNDVNIQELVELTDKYSGAEITALCNEAAYLALESDINSKTINQINFKNALNIVVPRTSQETIDYFDKFHSMTALHTI